MRKHSFILFLLPLFFGNCFIEEEFTLSEKIIGRWAFSGRTAFYPDGSSDRNLPLDVCEFDTEFIFDEKGSLRYLDFTEKEVSDGSIDFCEENQVTSEEGFWSISPSDKLIIVLKNSQDGSDIVIAPYAVDVEDDDTLNIRYSQFETGDEVSYYRYHYFRIFN